MASCKGTDKVIKDASKDCLGFPDKVQCVHGVHWTKDSVEMGMGDPAQQAELKSKGVIPAVGVCSWGGTCSFEKYAIDHFCDKHENEPHCNSAGLCRWV